MRFGILFVTLLSLPSLFSGCKTRRDSNLNEAASGDRIVVRESWVDQSAAQVEKARTFVGDSVQLGFELAGATFLLPAGSVMDPNAASRSYEQRDEANENLTQSLAKALDNLQDALDQFIAVFASGRSEGSGAEFSVPKQQFADSIVNAAKAIREDLRTNILPKTNGLAGKLLKLRNANPSTNLISTAEFKEFKSDLGKLEGRLASLHASVLQLKLSTPPAVAEQTGFQGPIKLTGGVYIASGAQDYEVDRRPCDRTIKTLNNDSGVIIRIFSKKTDAMLYGGRKCSGTEEVFACGSGERKCQTPDKSATISNIGENSFLFEDAQGFTTYALSNAASGTHPSIANGGVYYSPGDPSDLCDVKLTPVMNSAGVLEAMIKTYTGPSSLTANGCAARAKGDVRVYQCFGLKCLSFQLSKDQNEAFEVISLTDGDSSVVKIHKFEFLRK